MEREKKAQQDPQGGDLKEGDAGSNQAEVTTTSTGGTKRKSDVNSNSPNKKLKSEANKAQQGGGGQAA